MVSNLLYSSTQKLCTPGNYTPKNHHLYYYSFLFSPPKIYKNTDLYREFFPQHIVTWSNQRREQSSTKTPPSPIHSNTYIKGNASPAPAQSACCPVEIHMAHPLIQSPVVLLTFYYINQISKKIKFHWNIF